MKRTGQAHGTRRGGDGRGEVQACEAVIAVTVGFGVEAEIANGVGRERDFLQAADIRANPAAFLRKLVGRAERHIAKRSVQFRLRGDGKVLRAKFDALPRPHKIQNIRLGGRCRDSGDFRRRGLFRRGRRLRRFRLNNRRFVRGRGVRRNAGGPGRRSRVRRRGRTVSRGSGRDAGGFRPVNLNG